MTKEEELKQAVVARNLKRNVSGEALANRINVFLGRVLPMAIAEDKPMVTIVFDRRDVTEAVWNELMSYCAKDAKGSYRRNLIAYVVAEVYKPYLADYEVVTNALGERNRPIDIVFYLNQD